MSKAEELAKSLIEVHNGHADEGPSTFSEAAAELRRLQAENKVLRKDAVRWRTFLSTRPQATHDVINQAIAALAKAEGAKE